MNRKAQSATEFVLLLSFMLLVFFVFFGILQQRISDITAKQDILYLQEANNVVLSELQLAEQVHADYTRTFSLDSLGDKSYSISFTDPYELTARFDDKSYVNFLSTPVGGELFLTKNNTLYKIDGLVRFPDGSIHNESSAIAGMYMNVNPEMCYYHNYTNNCSGLRGLTSDAFMEACDDYYPCEWIPGTLPNILGYWKFDEGSGDVTLDLIGKENATINEVGGNIWSDPAYCFKDGCLMIDGGNNRDNVVVGVDERFDVEEYSISVWVKPFSYQGGDDRIITRRSPSPDWDEFNFNLGMGTGYPLITHINGSTYPDDVFNTYAYAVDLRDGDWHHVVGMYNGTHHLIYVDGTLENASLAGGPPRTDGPQVLIFGQDPYSNTNNYAGRLDEVQIYDRALTASEVLELYVGS